MLNELFNLRTYHGAVGRELGTVKVPYLDYTGEANFGDVSINKSGARAEVTLWKLDALSLQAQDVEGRCRGPGIPSARGSVPDNRQVPAGIVGRERLQGPFPRT